ncbi:hypothetical protein PPACK8108_LOCUS842 [Phakopsora pachyrhizi]|uniref:Uncharacterized protein n=1 Tax=Phakopsora pachyrhizi TaxID=170000 RepID=A0AAV0AGS2_PHAPC|nr:hypothetical protein PPACK8108_LOCUS842 [Phakopsora pachyrhizi]
MGEKGAGRLFLLGLDIGEGRFEEKKLGNGAQWLQLIFWDEFWRLQAREGTNCSGAPAVPTTQRQSPSLPPQASLISALKGKRLAQRG